MRGPAQHRPSLGAGSGGWGYVITEGSDRDRRKQSKTVENSRELTAITGRNRTADLAFPLSRGVWIGRGVGVGCCLAAGATTCSACNVGTYSGSTGPCRGGVANIYLKSKSFKRFITNTIRCFPQAPPHARPATPDPTTAPVFRTCLYQCRLTFSRVCRPNHSLISFDVFPPVFLSRSL